jgi:hypothetical protein
VLPLAGDVCSAVLTTDTAARLMALPARAFSFLVEAQFRSARLTRRPRQAMASLAVCQNPKLTPPHARTDPHPPGR